MQSLTLHKYVFKIFEQIIVYDEPEYNDNNKLLLMRHYEMFGCENTHMMKLCWYIFLIFCLFDIK